MLKKIALISFASMLTLGLAACGDNNATQSNDQGNQNTTNAVDTQNENTPASALEKAKQAAQDAAGKAGQAIQATGEAVKQTGQDLMKQVTPAGDNTNNESNSANQE